MTIISYIHKDEISPLRCTTVEMTLLCMLITMSRICSIGRILKVSYPLQSSTLRMVCHFDRSGEISSS